MLSLGFYFIWCFYFFYGRCYRNDYLLVIAAVVFAITAVYLFPFLFISYIKSFQKVWTSLFLVSIVTLLIFLFIPSANSLIYNISVDKKWDLKRNKIIKTLEKNEKEVKYFVPKNIKINKQFEVAIEKMRTEQRRVEKIEPKTEETILVKGKSNRVSPETKINSKVDNTDLDLTGQEIIFKVQIISSDNHLAINSSKFKGLKNVWEYEDGGFYKYTVGNEKKLKSASVLQLELRRKGFAGAFVIAFKNGNRIPVREARKLLN